MRAVGRTLGINEAAYSFPLAGVVCRFEQNKNAPETNLTRYRSEHNQTIPVMTVSLGSHLKQH